MGCECGKNIKNGLIGTLSGNLVRGFSAYDAAKIAADYTVKCIENTQGDPDHWYGAKFEKALPELIKALG